MRHYLIAVCTTLVTAAGLFAQTTSQTRVLLPLNVDLTKGLYGSVWLTDLALANHGESPLDVRGLGPDECAAFPCTPPPIRSHTTVFAGYVRCAAPGGRLLYVDSARLSDLGATLRTRDTTRQDQTWGTAIPVVTDKDLFSSTFSLVNVPLDARFRSTLRIYDVDPSTPAQISVRFYRMGVQPGQPDVPDTLLRSIVPIFATTPGPAAQFCGASAEIHLWDYQELVSAGSLRIEVVPADLRKEYWGFVSVTHNDTQHVTVIATLK